MAKRTVKRTRTKTAARKRTTKKKGSTKAKGSAKKKGAAKKKGSANRRTAKARPARKPARRPQASKRPTRVTAAAAALTGVRGAVAGAISAVTRVLPGTSEAPDAITLLEADHRRMEGLLAQGEETTERAVRGRTELLDKLTAELNLHELIEEEVLYPALKAHPEAREIVLEGYQEHHVADLIVKELHEVAKDDERWGAKFKVLKESLDHHIEEEEGHMFKTARSVLGRDRLEELGQRMTAMKGPRRQTRR